MFDEAQLPCVKDAIKGYGAATGAKVNKEKINGLQLGTWTGKSIPSCLMGH